MQSCSTRFVILQSTKNFLHMNIRLNSKEITDAYSTPIVQQTSFWVTILFSALTHIAA